MAERHGEVLKESDGLKAEISPAVLGIFRSGQRASRGRSDELTDGRAGAACVGGDHGVPAERDLGQ